MHVGLIAANTSTVQSVHVRTRASYALLPFLMVLGAMYVHSRHTAYYYMYRHATVTYASITYCICPTFYSGVHKVTEGHCCVGGKIILIVPKNVSVV